MKRICRHALSAAAALALTGGFAVATALPAAAAPGPANYAYGASARGPLANVFPIAVARWPGLLPVASIAHINVAHIVGAGPVLDVAGRNGAASFIGAVNVLGSIGLPALTVRAASSSCTVDSTPGDLDSKRGTIDSQTIGASGKTTLFGGLLNSGLFRHFLPVHPAPNTKVRVPGIATVTLNKQVIKGNTLTVTALSVVMLRGAQTISAGVSVCTGGSNSSESSKLG
jgi:hypothetical protein